ncbi:putative transposase (plasmid) [Rhodococcus opacus B4]|uniref:Putative transposase n=1 Tax=Rhodococcus opacus (strain B4) TaxID=632772 RepID=C1BBV5_RHOOB|nr:putative transposase [Rhodococcus opacus B4]
MGRQSLYTEEFRKDAVALYRAADGKRTYAAVAADVGVSGETLRTWVRKDPAAKPVESTVVCRVASSHEAEVLAF